MCNVHVVAIDQACATWCSAVYIVTATLQSLQRSKIAVVQWIHKHSIPHVAMQVNECNR